MVRLKDIAARAGVSVMTVSKALRDAHDVSAGVKAKIRQLAQELGYVPDTSAAGLRTRTTRLLGVVVSSLTSPIFSRVALAIEERAFELGYDVLVAQTLDKAEKEEACIRRLIARRVDGLFVVPAYRMATEARVYQDLVARKIPTVVLGHLVPFCNQFVNVEGDDLLGGYAAAQHLLKLGHKRIAFLSGPPATPWTQERFEGYRRALREFGLDVDDKLLFQAGRSVEQGEAAALQILNEAPDITAIQAVNDTVAVGVVETLFKQGIRVPEDISVVGFGNILLGRHFRVPLTTLRQPKYRLGVAAVELMQQLLLGKRPEPKRLSADLIVRDSSGMPPATPVLKRLKTDNSSTETRL